MTVIDTALRDHLRALKLSGMLETLNARLTQATAGELGHLDFLQVLCHDEITRRESTAMDRRLRRAHFDEATTLEEFNFTASPKLPSAQIRDLFAMRELPPGQADDLYDLTSHPNHHGRSLIITSNRSPVDWYPLFPNPVVAESLLDRLINTSHQVFMNGPSYRPNKRPTATTR